MTSDAKIGLLLGLVFIFIIAFIINGLPRLRGEAGSNELTEIMMKNDPPGIGGWERKADEVLNPPPQIAEETFEPQQPSDNSAQAFPDNSDIRYSVPIPGYSSLVRDSFGQQESEMPIGPVRTLDAHSSVSPPAIAGDKETIAGTIEPERTIPLRPVKLAKPKTHVVASGETLASIAKKFYGSEEGNRRANVAKIFEANRKLLKSADEIRVGQKLIIPALPSPTKSKGLFSGPSFEQVVSIGQKATFGVTPNITSGRLYTVKEGDSLWKISAEKLGSGVRYKEIARLNADILPNEDDVRVGMCLKMPAK